MKIRRINSFFSGAYLFTKVETEDGTVGIGEAGDWAHLNAVRAQIDVLSEYFVGKDARMIEHPWQYIQRSTFFRSTALSSALSSIDIALWDIKGQSHGVPVHDLLGGPTRNKVRSYAIAMGDTPDEIAAACVRVRDLGFNAARIVLPSFVKNDFDSQDHIHARRVGLAVDKVLACRDAVGRDFDLCVEAHRAYSVSEAIAIGRGIAAANPLFFEYPISPDGPEAMAKVVKGIDVAIATGERALTLAEFATLCNIGVNILRPDVCVLGGLTPAIKVAALAEANEAQIVPHNPLGPVSTAACIQLCASSSSFLIQEFPSFNLDVNENSMLAAPLDVNGGYISVPTGAGIGVRLADDIEDRFPGVQRALLPASRRRHDAVLRQRLPRHCRGGGGRCSGGQRRRPILPTRRNRDRARESARRVERSRPC